MAAGRVDVSAILRSARIRGKLVILCEGEHVLLEGARPASPQTYARLENTPDANFYRACIPRDWHNSRLPQFFNCGGRAEVIQTYQNLLKRHRARPEDSFLDPEKLYALVDLDLQAGSLPAGYPWATTEDVHEALYADGLVKGDPSEGHRIWVTALVHKEAFFVLPVVEDAWGEGMVPFLDDAPVRLQKIHAEAARALETDADLAGQIERAGARLGRFTVGSRLDVSCGRRIQETWTEATAGCSQAEYEVLVRALLSVAKIKDIWTRIVPDPRGERTLPAETFREQLGLNVARRIGDLSPTEHPLAGFFAWLKPRR